MNKGKTLLGAGILVAVILIIMVITYIGIYNSLIKSNENVNNKWAQVETQYQRRVELIPNLVSTVKGYANFEQETLTEITSLRSQWQNSQTTEEKVTTANQIETTLSKLLVIIENYPDLKASQSFIALQDELTNTENKISVERTRYNDAVREFNTKIKIFPENIVANSLGYDTRKYFESKPGSEEAPIVDFN